VKGSFENIAEELEMEYEPDFKWIDEKNKFGVLFLIGLKSLRIQQ
jgi:hypothetical protein